VKVYFDAAVETFSEAGSSPLKLLLSGAAFTGSLFFIAEPAWASCDNYTPTAGQTVTCNTSSPNPATINVLAATGSTNVTVTNGAASSVTISRTTNPTAISVDSSSVITNNGMISLAGGGGTGGNRGAALVGTGNNNQITNGAQGVVSTTGTYNDGMAANGSGNILINNGAITTTGPNAYGMTAAWGQTNTGQLNNMLVNTGSVATTGSNARAASILGGSGTVNNSGTLTTNGNSSTAVYMQGNNDHLINSGIIHATGAGSEGVFSNTLSASFTATIDNLAGGQIISDQDAALRTLNGSTTITNAGLIQGTNGTALNGGNSANSKVTLILQTGSQIVGLADGGGGTNQVQLQGTGTITNTFARFQTLYMQGADWTWNGSGTFADSYIQSGTFRLQSNLTGNVSIAAGTSLLAGNGANPSITPYPGGPAITVTNAGTIDLTNGGSATANSLTIQGSYVGSNGALLLRTQLGDDSSPSDRLVISGGAASGTTGIGVTNVGGGGAATVQNGIMLVQATNGATTTASAFSLNGGSLSVGAHEYVLFRGGVTSGTADNWYLRSEIIASPMPAIIPTPTPAPGSPSLPLPTPVPLAPTPPTTENPNPPPPVEPTPIIQPAPPTPGATAPVAAVIQIYRPEAPAYAVVPLAAHQLALTSLGTFHERQGEQASLSGNGVVSAIWGRVFGQKLDQKWGGTVSPAFDGTQGGFQLGVDLFGKTSDGGKGDHFGVFAGRAWMTGDIRGFALGWNNLTVGRLKLNGTSVGGYWTHVGPGGWYIDAVAMGSWYGGSSLSSRGVGIDTDGKSVTLSLESGYPINLAPGLTFEPQAQIIWQRMMLDNTNDAFSTVDFSTTSAFTGRIGGRLLTSAHIGATRLQPYFKMNLWRDFNAQDSILFGGSDAVVTQRAATAVELGGGLGVQFSSSVSLNATGGYSTAFDHNKREGFQGTIGFRVAW
jgi:outer membrane autotransporter protein